MRTGCLVFPGGDGLIFAVAGNPDPGRLLDGGPRRITMARYLSILTLGLVLFACTTKVEEVETPELGDCCNDSLELVAQMPDCCQKGVAVAGQLVGCCETGMTAETADADRPDCCKKGKELLDQMSVCCQGVILEGKAEGCCTAMPAELKKHAG